MHADSNDIKMFPPFVPEPVKIGRMRIIGSTTGSYEVVHCEYISVILYVSIFIARRITEKRITLDPHGQRNIRLSRLCNRENH